MFVVVILMALGARLPGAQGAGPSAWPRSGPLAAASRGAVLPGRAITSRVRDITLRVDPRRQGLGAWTQTWGDNLVFDKNHDGVRDVLLSFHTRRWEIWLGTEAGAFTFDQGLTAVDRHNCVAADFGRPAGSAPDGLVDLYCVRGAGRGSLSDKANAMLIQRGDGTFVDRVMRWRAADRSGRGRVVSLLHARPDARPSLFLGNAPSIEFPSKDRLLVNVRGRFRNRHTAGLPADRGTVCSDTGDYDHDGRQDFLSCSGWSHARRSALQLLLFHNATTRSGPVVYRLRGHEEGIPRQARRDAELVDVSGDGWADLVTVSRHALVVRLNSHRRPHFADVDYRFPLVAGQSFCVGAANGDDVGDILVVQSRASERRSMQARDWLLVNRGNGTHFRELRVPQPPRRFGNNGVGDTCTALPAFQGRRAAWTINNGLYPHAGYRQLVILSR